MFLLLRLDIHVQVFFIEDIFPFLLSSVYGIFDIDRTCLDLAVIEILDLGFVEVHVVDHIFVLLLHIHEIL